MLETNRRCTNLSPYGEPQLGRRGLYRSAGGAVATPDDERALLWVLNQSDGRATLLDVARDSGLAYPLVRRAAERLERAGLLAEDRRPRSRAAAVTPAELDLRPAVSTSGARMLEGRTCVVTGASGGIGRAIAVGARVGRGDRVRGRTARARSR